MNQLRQAVSTENSNEQIEEISNNIKNPKRRAIIFKRQANVSNTKEAPIETTIQPALPQPASSQPTLSPSTPSQSTLSQSTPSQSTPSPSTLSQSTPSQPEQGGPEEVQVKVKFITPKKYTLPTHLQVSEESTKRKQSTEAVISEKKQDTENVVRNTLEQDTSQSQSIQKTEDHQDQGSVSTDQVTAPESQQENTQSPISSQETTNET